MVLVVDEVEVVSGSIVVLVVVLVVVVAVGTTGALETGALVV